MNIMDKMLKTGSWIGTEVAGVDEAMACWSNKGGESRRVGIFVPYIEKMLSWSELLECEGSEVQSRSLSGRHVSTGFLDPVLGAMMKQVCWHSRRSKAYRGLPEARMAGATVEETAFEDVNMWQAPPPS